MLARRVASALVGGPVVLAAIWVGGWPFLGLVALVALGAAVEFYRLLERREHHPHRGLGLASIALLLLVAGGPLRVDRGLALVAAMTLSGLAVMAWPVVRPAPDRSLDAALTLFGVVYLGWLPGHLLLLRQLADGRWLVLALVAVVWAFDSAAYFAGPRWGKRRLAPAISPKKTVVGTVAGTGAAAAVLGLAAPWLGLPVPVALAAGLLLAAVAQVGDLAESAWKRYAGVKDASGVIPGHGGMMDRFDGLLLAAPVAYYLARWAGYTLVSPWPGW